MHRLIFPNLVTVMSLEPFSIKFIYRLTRRFTRSYSWLFLASCCLFANGCSSIFSEEAQSNSARSAQQISRSPAVEVAIARQSTSAQNTQYIGTTFPVREVSLRSRIEGQILELNVDVGDRVEKGQILARIDNSLNQASVLEAEAELEALRSEVTSLQADVNQSLTQVKQAQITLQQAKSDLIRSNQLVQEGAVTRQSAEQAQNAVANAQQALESAQQQVSNRSSAVVAAQRRVIAQKAIVAQAKQQELFAFLTSPITGSVLAKTSEPGDLAQVGDEVLQLGDFSQIQVQVQISELELSKIRVGQPAQVTLDALSGRTFTGKVTQISLVADATARLIPIEITIPNLDDRIGRGLLARVSFAQPNQDALFIPESAIKIDSAQTPDINLDSQNPEAKNQVTIFVLQGEGEQAIVKAREVIIGDRINSQVEILDGLNLGERFVVRSSDDLQDGAQVRLSFLSES